MQIMSEPSNYQKEPLAIAITRDTDDGVYHTGERVVELVVGGYSSDVGSIEDDGFMDRHPPKGVSKLPSLQQCYQN